jgi:hypothetical protein
MLSRSELFGTTGGTLLFLVPNVGTFSELFRNYFEAVSGPNRKTAKTQIGTISELFRNYWDKSELFRNYFGTIGTRRNYFGTMDLGRNYFGTILELFRNYFVPFGHSYTVGPHRASLHCF